MSRIAAVLCLTLLLAGPVLADDPPAASEQAQKLVERERVRSALISIYEELAEESPSREVTQQRFDAAVERVAALGKPAIEMLIPDIENATHGRFLFTAYALGRLGAPEAVEPLRRALEAADAEGGEFARYRKAWAVIGLAMLGRPEFLAELDGGALKVSTTPVGRGLTAMELAAMAAGPPAAEHLMRLLDREVDDIAVERGRHLVLKALSWIDADGLAAVGRRFAGDDSVRVRREALWMVARHGSAEDRKLLIEALADPVDAVASTAAQALAETGATGLVDEVLARLETETRATIRGWLCTSLIEPLGDRLLRVLRAELQRPSGLDRLMAVRTLGRMDGKTRRNLLGLAVSDPDGRVQAAALYELSRIEGRASEDALLVALNSESFALIQAATNILVARHHPAAAPRLTARMLQVELPAYTDQTAVRTAITVMCNALVDLGYHDAADGIEKAAERVTEGTLRGTLEETVRKLRRLGALPQDPAALAAGLAKADADERMLIYTKLACIRTPEAAGRLIAAFDLEIGDDERERILDLLTAIAPQRTEALVVRVLEDPAFHTPARREVLDRAAWLGRQIGSAAVREALAACIRRYEGREFLPLVYYAQLVGADALPLWNEVRYRRMRHVSMHRGEEQQRLLWLMRALAAGRSVRSMDLPPEQLHFAG